MLGAFSCLGPLGIALGIGAKAVVGGVFEHWMVRAVKYACARVRGHSHHHEHHHHHHHQHQVAITAGTFIYVGATEVIAEEFEEPANRWSKFGALASGMATIGLVMYFGEGLEHGALHDH